ncbi:MAG: hybrid sensor histidine kinase/response regulator, partial [Calditrichaeota bacterium]
ENILYIQTDSALFEYRPDSIKTIQIPDAEQPAGIYEYNDSLLIRTWKNDTSRYYTYYNTTLKETDFSQFLHDGIITIHPIPGNGYIAITFDAELIFIQNHKIRKVRLKLPDQIASSFIQDMVPISQNLFAIIANPYGILFVNENGDIIYYFDIESNLLDQNANCLLQDHQQGLWIGTDNGIMRLEYPSPFMHFGKESGISTGISDIAEKDGTLYVSAYGRFYSIDGSQKSKKFFDSDLGIRFGIHEIPEMRGWNWGLDTLDNQLLITQFQSLSVYKNRKIKKYLTDLYIYASYLPSSRNDIFYVSTFDSVLAVRYKNNKMTILSKTFTGHAANVHIMEDSLGNIWLDSYGNGFFRLEYERPDQPARVFQYGKESGLPNSTNNILARINNRLIFMTENGLYRFDYRKQEFYKDERPLAQAAGERLYLTAWNYKNNVLMCSRDSLFYFRKGADGHYIRDDSTFGRIAHNSFEAFFERSNGQLVFGGADGIILYTPSTVSPKTIPYRTSLRFVRFGDQTVYDGMYNSNAGNIYKNIGRDTVRFHPVPYARNSVHFKFSIASFDGDDPNRYRYMLKGYDRSFSSWSAATEKEYTNLAPGAYTFVVQGKDAYNHIYPSAEFQFRILPPWYQTTWAYITYLFALFSFIYLIVSWRSRTLRRLVNERTHELLEANKHLKKAKAEAEQATHFKSLFLANMSHEIRTPLNAIIGMNTLLKDTPVNDEQKEFLDAINISSESLLSIVNDILDFSKIEAGKLEIENVTFSLRQIIEDVAAVCRVNGAPKNLETVTTLPDNLPALFLGDPVRIRQILLNFCTNAVKFTEKGRITISVKIPDDPTCRKDGYAPLLISVADTGMGIPEEKQKHIFESFQQADISTTRKHGGTGLGLTICKMLTELMGGAIGVNSTVGEGSEFWIRLCLKVIHTQSDLSHNENNIPLDDEHIFGKIHVLVAEDNAINQKVITRILQKKGIQHTIVSNGQEAVDYLRRHTAHVVLMDIQMPVMDGMEATRQIRKDMEHPRQTVPIIALTANAVKGDKERCMAAGMNDYLSKPINVETLMLLIKKYGAESLRN